MKHIHQRDMLKLWEEFLSNFTHMVSLDRESGYLYIKKFIWYTDSKIDADDHRILNSMILDHLPDNDGEEVMKTIADQYIEQGIEQGIIQGMEQGQQITLENTTKNMLSHNCDSKLIEEVTGLTAQTITKLKSQM